MVNTMENAEEVMQILDRFTRLKQKEIPKELDDYLQYVAKTGDTVFKWSSLKYLFREKLLNVIKHFHDTTPRVDEIPQYPNVDPFNYESMKSSLLERLEHFNAAPFTIQRLCELLIDPRKQYSRIDKFMRALEKNILVVSTVEPGRKRTDSENGDSLDSVVNGDLSLDVNVDIEMDNEALFAIEGQNGNGAVPVAVAAVVEALNECKDKSAVAIIATENSNASRSGDDDILPHPKKAKLELNDNEKNLKEEEKVHKEKEKQDLNNGNEEKKPEVEVATCLEKTEKVEEKKLVEENGNTVESEKNIEAKEKQENDVEMEDKAEVKKVEKPVEEQIVVEEKQKKIEKNEEKESTEIKAEHKNESVSNDKDIEKVEKANNDVNEKSLSEQKVVVDGNKNEKVIEPQEVLKQADEQVKAETVEKEEIKNDLNKPQASANDKKIIEKVENVEEKSAETAEETTSIPTQAATIATIVQEKTALDKTVENESKDTVVETAKNIEKQTVAESDKIISASAEAPTAASELATKPAAEQKSEQIPEKVVETPAVEEKVVKEDEKEEQEIKTDTAVIAAKPQETEKATNEQLTASTENKKQTVEDVKTPTVADTVAVTDVTVAATIATVAEEQKTEQLVSADKKAASEDVSSAAVIAEPIATEKIAQESTAPATIVAEEVEDNMQMPIETDSPIAAGIVIEEMPSAMVSSELVVPTIPIVNETSPAAGILAPALSLNDQPMEDLPMEESIPEEVIMAESVATGNGGLIEMATDAMEASGKDELPVDGMDVDDTSQEAMDH